MQNRYPVRMYEQERIIRLRETDATGVLFFSEKLKLALEVFESYLYDKGITVQQMIEASEFLMPIVHAEADYSAPLRKTPKELRATRDKADPVWSDVLSALDDRRADTRPQLVLNHRNPLVRRITALPTPDLVELAVEALYGQALLLGYHPIRPADAALLNRSFLGLLDRAVPTDQEGGA